MSSKQKSCGVGKKWCDGVCRVRHGHIRALRPVQGLSFFCLETSASVLPEAHGWGTGRALENGNGEPLRSWASQWPPHPSSLPTAGASWEQSSGEEGRPERRS